MKFLATGDLQCGNFKQFNILRSDGIGSRLHNCLRIFRLLRKEAIKRKIDKILLNGDIFEKNGVLEVEVFDAVYREVEKMHRAGLKVVMNIGNHDVTRASTKFLPSLHSLRIFNRIAEVVETPRLVWSQERHGPGGLYVIPWMAENQALLDAANQARHYGPYGLVLHAGIAGAWTGKGQILPGKIHLEDLHPKRFQLVLLSDYHQSQWIGKNAFYLGSPLQHSFGETHEGCVWEVTLQKDRFDVKPIPTGSPRFRWISIKTLSDARNSFREYPKSYFRVQVLPNKRKVDFSELQKLAEHYGHLIQVENAPVYEKEEVRPASTISGMHHVVKQYTANPQLRSLGLHILDCV